MYDDTGEHYIRISLHNRYSGFRYDICYNFFLNSLFRTVYKDIILKLKIKTHKICNIKDGKLVGCILFYAVCNALCNCKHTLTL